jgi:hypothetical protein
MNNVLLISYYFPPCIEDSAIRAGGYAKHLHVYGWKPCVLTVEDIYYDVVSEKYNLSNIDIHRIKSWEFIHKKSSEDRREDEPMSEVIVSTTDVIKHIISGILIPDEKILWIPYALRKIKKIISEKKLDLIYTIAPPYSVSLLGYYTYCQTNIPWIADIRENWVGNNPIRILPSIRRNIEKKMEELIIKTAKKIISTSNEWCQFFYEKYPFWGKDKFICIPDGFDNEEIERCHSNDSFSEYKEIDKLKLVYIGQINKKITHQFLLKAIKELLRTDTYLKDQLKVIFVGSMDTEHLQMIQELHLKDIVKYIPDISGEKMMDIISVSDIGIVLSQEERSIPATIYKYIGMRKPVLGLTNGGATENLIKRENLGWIAPFSGIPGIKKILLKLVDYHRKGLLKPGYSAEISMKYEKKELTKRLAEIFDMSISEGANNIGPTKIERFGYRGIR